MNGSCSCGSGRARTVIVALALVLSSFAAAIPTHGAPETQDRGLTTVILVRHAEKAATGDPEFEGASSNDPPLTAAGNRRAAVLAQTLAEAGVTAVYASEYQRTQLTVQPLAVALGLEVVELPAADTAGLAARVVAEHAGGVVVIAGHSNTVPRIIEALGAGPIAAIEDAWEYDNLYFVTIGSDGSARVATLKFGARSIPGGGF